MANHWVGGRLMAARMWWLPLVPFGILTDRGSRSRWLLMPAVVILTALTSSLGKLVIRRPRPGSTDRVPWGRLGPAGFPSTHAACAFAVATWLRASPHGRRLHVLAALIGLARVRSKAHHSTDVAAGAIVGYTLARQMDRAWQRLGSGSATALAEDSDKPTAKEPGPRPARPHPRRRPSSRRVPRRLATMEPG